MIFPKAYQPKADGQHTSMAEESNSIVGVSELWCGLLGKALKHVFREAYGAEDITCVDRHVDSEFRWEDFEEWCS